VIKEITVAFLVVAMTPAGCDIGNVDRTNLNIVGAYPADECETLAKALDEVIGVRAKCVPKPEEKE